MRHSPSRSRLLAGSAVVAATAAMLLIPAQGATAKATSECAAGGVKVVAGASAATVSVNDTTTSTSVQVTATITGTTFAITSVDSGVTLTGATWCLKASTKTQSGAGTTGTSAITNGKGVAQKISHLVVYDVTTPSAWVDPVGSCWDGDGSNADFTYDFKYIGPINDLGNGLQILSDDGSCNGEPLGLGWTIVRATDEASAGALCLNLTGSSSLTGRPRDLGYRTAPADFWLCV